MPLSLGIGRVCASRPPLLGARPPPRSGPCPVLSFAAVTTLRLRHRARDRLYGRSEDRPGPSRPGAETETGRDGLPFLEKTGIPGDRLSKVVEDFPMPSSGPGLHKRQWYDPRRHRQYLNCKVSVWWTARTCGSGAVGTSPYLCRPSGSRA